MNGLQKLTPRRVKRKWAKAFLNSLRKTGNITQSALYAGVSRVAAWKAAKKHPVFRRAMEAALLESEDVVLAEAQRRAMIGVDKVIIYKGQPQGIWIDENRQQVSADTPGAMLIPFTVKEYSDALLLHLLKRRIRRRKKTISPLTVNVQNNNVVGNDDIFARIGKYRQAIHDADTRSETGDPLRNGDGQSVVREEADAKPKTT